MKKKPFIRRLLASFFDYITVFSVVSLLPPILYLEPSTLTLILFLVFVPMIFFPIDLLLLKLFNTTPGRALFGFKLKKLPLKQLCKISFGYALTNQLLLIPGVNIVFSIIEARRKRQSLSTFWSEEYEEAILPTKLVGRISALILAGILSCFTYFHQEAEDFITQKFPQASEWASKESGKWSTSNWAEIRSENEDFVVHFPKEPKKIEKSLPVPKSKEKLPYSELNYKDEGSVLYTLGYVTLPNPWMKWSNSFILKGAMKVISATVSNSRIEWKKKGSWSSYPSTDFVLSQRDQIIKGKLVLVDNVLYRLEAKYPKTAPNEDKASADKFLESFEVTR